MKVANLIHMWVDDNEWWCCKNRCFYQGNSDKIAIDVGDEDLGKI